MSLINIINVYGYRALSPAIKNIKILPARPENHMVITCNLSASACTLSTNIQRGDILAVDD